MSILSFINNEEFSTLKSEMLLMKKDICVLTHGKHYFDDNGVCKYCGANGADECAILVDGESFNRAVITAMPSGGTATFVSFDTIADEDTYTTTIDLTDSNSNYTVYGYVNTDKNRMLIKSSSYGLKANPNSANMFSGSTITYSGLDNIDVSDVTDASSMFKGNTGIATVSELSGWNVSNIVNMTSMFENCTLLTNVLGLSNWVINSSCLLDTMFGSVGVTDFSPLDNWNITEEKYVTTTIMFGNTTIIVRPSWLNIITVAILKSSSGSSSIFNKYRMNFTNIITHTQSDITSDDIISDESSQYPIYMLFDSDINTINIHTTANKIRVDHGLQSMFYNCLALTDIYCLNDWDVSNVTDMSNMFFNCKSLVDISGLANCDTSEVTNMSYMFTNCNSLADISPLANWDVSNVTNMSFAFYGCTSLSDISPLANWDVSNAENISSMFNGCTSLEDASCLESWNVDNAGNMGNTFPSICTILPSWYTD